jgi:hypothetical protein
MGGMKSRHLFTPFAFIGLLSAVGLLSANPQSAGQDMKDAGKNTTSAVKKGTTKSTKAVKKGANKAADETEKGAGKAKNKTTDTTSH